MNKVKTNVHETKTVTRTVSLSNGGFIEIEMAEIGDGYLKVHVSKREDDLYYGNQAWRYIQHGKDDKNIKILREIRDAANKLLESIAS